MALIELRGAREITERKEKSRDHAKDDDPKPLEDGMPEVPKIESAAGHWIVLLHHRRIREDDRGGLVIGSKY